jgi:hypothetical protein
MNRCHIPPLTTVEEYAEHQRSHEEFAQNIYAADEAVRAMHDAGQIRGDVERIVMYSEEECALRFETKAPNRWNADEDINVIVTFNWTEHMLIVEEGGPGVYSSLSMVALELPAQELLEPLLMRSWKVEEEEFDASNVPIANVTGSGGMVTLGSFSSSNSGVVGGIVEETSHTYASEFSPEPGFFKKLFTNRG